MAENTQAPFAVLRPTVITVVPVDSGFSATTSCFGVEMRMPGSLVHIAAEPACCTTVAVPGPAPANTGIWLTKVVTYEATVE